MGIASAIMALAPTGYWHLDEVAGPTALDASGNGHNLPYQSGVIFEQAGPEAGTYSAYRGAPGGVAYQTNVPWSTSATFTLLAWIAVVGNLYGSLGQILVNTNSASSGAALAQLPSGGGWGYEIGRFPVGYSGVLGLGVDTRYHQVALVGTPTNTSCYIDGVLTGSAGGATVAPVNPTVGLNGLWAGYHAHLAFWNGTALTAGQQAAIVAARVSPQEVPTVSGSGGYDQVVTALAAQSDILDRILAAVTYLGY